MRELYQTILGSSIVTTIFTSAIAYYFHKREQQVNSEIKREFDRISQILNTDFEWKRQTTELLGQVYIHLSRTRIAMDNTYSKLQAYDPIFEDEVIYHSNKVIRDILIANGHHLPPELLDEASKLIEHYDAWLVEYHKIRKINHDTATIQIYVGPMGFAFPSEAEGKFKEKYQGMFEEIRQV
jgi:hypothetical protein